jgi:hypothetical protein
MKKDNRIRNNIIKRVRKAKEKFECDIAREKKLIPRISGGLSTRTVKQEKE